MFSNKPFCSILIFLFSIWSGFGQDLDYVINYADHHYNLSNYKTAITEYKRAIYFADTEHLPDLYRQTANSYFFIQNYPDAISYYDKAVNSLYCDSVKAECLFQKISCYMLLEQFRFAIQELDKMIYLSSEYFVRKRNFYFGICNFGSQQFDASFESFLNAISETDTVKIQKLTKLFQNKGKLYHPSPKTAKFLSIIIPGSGQIYGGDIKSGINSLFVLGGLVYMGVYLSKLYNSALFMFSITPWIQRYYLGGIRNAGKIAESKRAINRSDYFNKILEIFK